MARRKLGFGGWMDSERNDTFLVADSLPAGLSQINFKVSLYKTLFFLKFGFSEKATKFEKIFVVLLTRASCSVRATAYLSKSRRRFFKTNVDKSYYTNFN